MVAPLLFEAFLLLSSLLGAIASAVLAQSHRGWDRVAWALITAGFGWLAFGELVMHLTGETALVLRWSRAVAFRLAVVSGILLLALRQRARPAR